MLYKVTFIGVSRKVNQIMATLLEVLLLAGPVMAETATDYGPITKSPTGQIRPGQFVWADLLTHDVPTAVNFYTNVFGWEVEYKDNKNYAHASIDGEPVAAIAAYNEGEDENAEGVWLMSVSVRDIRNAGQAVKAAGGTWKMGGTGTGQEDSLVTAMLEKEFDIKVTYVPFKGGGDVAKNLVGGHIDSTVNNPSEQLGFYNAGKSRPIATFTPERLAAFPDTPTLTELGHALVYDMQRSFVAPKGMDPAALAYYTAMFEKVNASEEWQTYTKEKSLAPDFLTGDDLQAYFIEERSKHADLLSSMNEGS